MQQQAETDADIAFIGSAVSHMVREIQQAIAIEELLETGAGPKNHALTKRLQERFNNTELVPTFSLLQLIMRRDLTLSMTRLHDGPQNGRMCFGEVFRKIQKPATRAAFIKMQGVRAKYHYDREAAEWLNSIIALWSQGIEDFAEHLATLRAARNVYLAHRVNEEPKLPTYTQLFDFVSFTGKLVEELGGITGVYLNGFDETRRIKRELALAFWSALIQSNWKSRRDLLQEIETDETINDS